MVAWGGARGTVGACAMQARFVCAPSLVIRVASRESRPLQGMSPFVHLHVTVAWCGCSLLLSFKPVTSGVSCQRNLTPPHLPGCAS